MLWSSLATKLYQRLSIPNFVLHSKICNLDHLEGVSREYNVVAQQTINLVKFIYRGLEDMSSPLCPCMYH